MDDIEEIRKRKLEELKKLQQQQMQDQQQEESNVQQIQMLESLVKQKLTKKALERYGNIKVAHPEKAVQLIAVLGQLIQAQQIEIINDEQLKELLQIGMDLLYKK